MIRSRSIKYLFFALGILFLSISVAFAATNTWTFNASTVGNYTFDPDLVSVDNSGAGPITGANKLSNPSFETNLSNWTSESSASLTLSGGLITDAVRTTNAEGDGLSVPSGYGIWESTLNYVTNGGIETDTTNWVAVGSAPFGRSTADKKFGNASILVQAPGLVLNEGVRINSVDVDPSQTYTASIWVNAPAGATMVLSFTERDAADVNIGTATNMNFTATGSWQRVSATKSFGATGVKTRFQIQTRLSAQDIDFYVDGAQIEQQPIATPYVETNGSTATRTAGRVQIPAGVFDETQGWAAFRVKAGWTNTQDPSSTPTLYQWRDDANNLLEVRYNTSSDQWEFQRRNTGGTAQVAVADTFTLADNMAIIAAWDATTLKLSVDGGAFTTQAGANIPTLSATNADIGTSTGSSEFINSNVLWFAGGLGTLSDADASTINGFGNTPPTSSPFPLSSTLSAYWAASTSSWESGSFMRDTSTTYLSSAGSARNFAALESNILQSVNVGDTDSYTLDVYAYTDGSQITSSDLSLFYNGSTISTDYASVGGGWYRLRGSLTGANASRNYGVQVENGNTVYLDDFTLYKQGDYTVENTTAFSPSPLTSWNSFASSLTATGNSSVTHQICLDDSPSCSYTTGSRWIYYTGGVWTNAADATQEFSNSSSELTPAAMNALSTASGKITVKSIFGFGGIYSPLLSSITIGYNEAQSSSSSSSSGESSSSCNSALPGSAPNLYAAIPQDESSIMLYFTNNINPVDGFAVQYGTTSNNYQFGATNIGSDSTRTFLVSSLQPNTTYYFRVSGENGCSVGPWSNELSVKTKGLVSINDLDIVDTALTPGKTQKPKPKVTPTPSSTKVSVTQTPTPTVEPDGYDVVVNVKDEEGQPVEGADVTIHSKVQSARTDRNGVASFENVEPGAHKVLIAYDGFEGEQAINLQGDVEQFELEVTVKPNMFSLSPLAIGIIVALVLIIGALITIILKGKNLIGKKNNLSTQL